jgi:hypothetical protein
MDSMGYGLGVLLLLSMALLLGNIYTASTAVGTVDTWEKIQTYLPTFVTGGLCGTVFLMITAGLFAIGLGPTATWSISLILAIFAFGTAFGAMAMASIESF